MLGPSHPSSDLLQVIRQVKRRWRVKVALRGLVRVLAVGVVAWLVAAYGMEAARFSASSILAARILIGIAMLAAVAWYLVLPLRRRVSDEQVALYLEEHEPSLRAAVLSAVEASRASDARASSALVARLVEQALTACLTVDAAHRVEQRSLRQHGAMLGGVALVALAAFLLGPGYFGHALTALLSRSLQAAAPYRIEVTPGDATLPKGADQTVGARLHGFESQEALLMVRRAATGPFEPLPLLRAEDGSYEGIVFNLAGTATYFVEASGVRSSVFTLNVVDLPYVQRLVLEYHFPAYTGLPPQKVEDGGDIAVLRGTEVRVQVVPTMAAPGGRIVLDEQRPVTLAPGEALTGSFTVERDGFYRIELEAPSGERVTASPQYTIDALDDHEPSVRFSQPGRDTSASAIEELFVEASAEDDYGVRNLELVYSVNGGAEKTVTLFSGRNRLPEVTAGHTFYFEELDVKPGDSVSYYARASDNDGVGGAKRATSDLYFVRIRPFNKDFRQAQSMGGGGGGGAGGGQVDALSEQQRQIIAATFNVQRNRRTYTKERLREATVVVALSQARLREQVEGIVTRMNSRLVEPDPAFARIAELLPQAVTAMQQAETALNTSGVDAALPFEHRALHFLQMAEEEYETQVSVARNGGGGGGGGQMSQELADLFELELDRMANQYETADRAMQQNADEQLDELLEKLKELARRQEQEAERRRRAAAGQAAASGGAQQRALAEQAEEAARRLERLSREENRPDLAEPARRLREAADAMRRAAASGDADAAAQTSAAIERLRETERRLQQSKAARVERDVKDARRQAEELAREQREIADGVRGLPAAGPERGAQVGQLADRKDALESRLADLERQLDRSAAEASRDERDAARRLSDAAGSIRDNRLRDKIRYSKAIISRGGTPEQAQAMEGDITAGFDELTRALGEAESALGRESRDPMNEALEKARRLARGMESLDQRLRERDGRQPSAGQESRGQASGQQSGGRESGNQQPGGEQSGGEQAEGQQAGGQQSGSSQQGGGQQGANAGQTTGGADGIGDTRGEWTGGGGYGDRRPLGLSRDDIRQFRGEVRHWSSEVRELRRLLQEGDLDPKALDEILRALRAMDDDRVYQDPEELQRLQTFVTDAMKRFEYGLRRTADANASEPVLTGSDEVPDAFRKLVEEYYRSLARTPR